MRTFSICQVRHYSPHLVAGLMALIVLGCGNPTDERDKARQAEAETAKQLQECQAELAKTRKELEAARKSSARTVGDKDTANARWEAARIGTQVFLEAVNSRNADAANDACTKDFRTKGGAKVVEVFSNGRFRGEAKGYTCGPLTHFEAVPGQDEFVGRGKLHYRGVPRQDSTYTVRVVKEGDKWRVASFSAVER